MKKLIVATGLLLTLCGCGSNEPSIRELENECRISFARHLGISPSQVSVEAERTGNGRWDIRFTATRYDGARRSLNATAVMDKNGDIHYYTD